ncbi:MAG: hypothetical protein WC840_07660 [Candidatus Peribacteraceae bacterium]
MTRRGGESITERGSPASAQLNCGGYPTCSTTLLGFVVERLRRVESLPAGRQAASAQLNSCGDPPCPSPVLRIRTI